MKKGFSLVEVVVGSALLVIVSLSVYEAYASVMKLSRGSGDKILATLIANEQIEVLHNLPYQSVGEIGGLPAGLLTHSTTTIRNNKTFEINTTIRNVDDPFDGIFPVDTSPSDYKLASVVVTCLTCTQTTVVDLTTTIAPKNLENVTNNGALFLSVTDALGAPVVGASINVVNQAQGLNKIDTTDVNGLLKIYEIIPASLAYAVTVTKAGFSTDRTYEPTPENQSPSVRALTAAAGTITSGSFSIDALSSLSVESVNSSCAHIGDFDFTIHGNKTIGTTNNDPVYKYSTLQKTSAGGLLSLGQMEWDYYHFLSNDFAYDLAGSLPTGPVNVTPGANVSASLVLKPRNPASLMVAVKDQTTKLPVSNATVTLTPASGSSETLITGVGSLGQYNWAGGAGQVDLIDSSKFYDSDGNIKISTANQLTLMPQGALYASSGWLTSSTFDLQTAGSLYKISWIPQDQPLETGNDPVKFQIASNNDNATWNYVGPDGTPGSFYTLTHNSIADEPAGRRYFRYKLYLTTSSTSYTPLINNITFQFTTSCTPSAEVLFQGLTKGQGVSLAVSAPGYSAVEHPLILISEDWQPYEVLLTHQ